MKERPMTNNTTLNYCLHNIYLMQPKSYKHPTYSPSKGLFLPWFDIMEGNLKG